MPPHCHTSTGQIVLLHDLFVTLQSMEEAALSLLSMALNSTGALLWLAAHSKSKLKVYENSAARSWRQMGKEMFRGLRAARP